MIIRTPDHRLRVFVSSTLKELAEERKAVRQAILKLRLAPVLFESGARPHPAQELYQSYISQSQIFIGIYWQSYGWVSPEMSISGLEDEYNLSANMPRLIYIKNPAPDRDPALSGLLDRIRDDNASCYTYFSTPQELKDLVQNDLALLLSEYFESVQQGVRPKAPEVQIPHTNVPVPRNPLIGRENLLTTACEMLLRDDIALITLTGPGGTGKSRLAIQIGLDMLHYFKDGVYLVNLEPISDPELVISTIASTMGVRETPGSRPLAEILKELFHEKQMLLLLDNFEQVVSAAPFVGELLEACPMLKIVVTSRVPLRLRAEKELPIPPLKVPSLANSSDVNRLSQYAAVELFIQRAQAIRPEFTVTNRNAPAVAEICYRLDGLPLAIELAAARIKLLTPQGILDRLENCFDLLRGGTRDLPERQRTLRSAIDWSYNLLNESEKKLFQRLSIFVGGWTLEAAEMVCDIEGDLAERADEVLESLIDNSLVFQIHDSEEYTRFGMLSTIHEYGRERLMESEEFDSVHYQHAQYYLNFVKKIEPLIRSAERLWWQQIMQQEFGNIRGVLDWIVRTGNCIGIGQQIVITLGMYWILSGNILEGKQWIDQISGLIDEATTPVVRAGLLGITGALAWVQGNHILAAESVEESFTTLAKSDITTIEDKRILALVTLIRGLLAASARDNAKAKESYLRGIEISRDIKDPWFEVILVDWLGDLALYENDIDSASSLYNQSIKLARQQGDPWGLTPSLMSTGQIALVRGDLANARSIFLEADAVLRKTGDHWSLSWSLNDLGHIMLMEDDLDQAGLYFLEAISLSKMMGNRRGMILMLTGTAALMAKRVKGLPEAQRQASTDLANAGRLCGAVLPYIDGPGVFSWIDSQLLYETDTQQVQSLMDKALWEKAFSDGQSMSFDEAVELAIQSLKID